MNDISRNIISLIKTMREYLDTLETLIKNDTYIKDRCDINQALFNLSTIAANLFFSNQHLQMVADVGKRTPCEECGGMGHTIGFEGPKRIKHPCETCTDTSPKKGVSLHKDGTWHTLACGGIYEGPFDSQDEADDHIDSELPVSSLMKQARSKPEIVFNPADHTWDVHWYIEIMTHPGSKA